MFTVEMFKKLKDAKMPTYHDPDHGGKSIPTEIDGELFWHWRNCSTANPERKSLEERKKWLKKKI